MKKKILLIVAALCALLVLSACGEEPAPSQATDGAPSEPVQQQSQEVAPPKESEPEVQKTAYEITYQNARVWNDSIGTTWVQTIVEITNTGSGNLYLSSGAYDLEDANGTLLASQTMVSAFPSVLAPGEKGYMYEETTLDDYSGDGKITVFPRPDVKEAKVDLIRYNVTDVKVSDDTYGGLKVLGRVENSTDADSDGMVYIVAFFYDASGNPIASAFTILTEDIQSGAKIGFELSAFSLPDDITASSVTETVVYAYPLQMQF